jgi:hypothetical protein
MAEDAWNTLPSGTHVLPLFSAPPLRGESTNCWSVASTSQATLKIGSGTMWASSAAERTLKDPVFLNDAEKAGIEIQDRSGQDVEKTVRAGSSTHRRTRSHTPR